MNDPETSSKKVDQFQTLGEILSLLDKLDMNDIEAITAGSYLGQVVKLLRNAKETLDVARDELKKEESLISNNLDRDSSNNQFSESSESNLNHNQIVIDYLKKALSDIEVFPDRKSIVDFFREAFKIEHPLKKESREDLIKKLCNKLIVKKDIKRTDIGEALLKKSNSKYGSFLKEKEDDFLKGWYKAIERM
jgi:hypothetical protein